jgi:hypothetical protein
MKLVVLTFAGRECSMKILFKLILKYKKYIHEYRLYVATTIQSDINYMEKFAASNDFVKIKYCKVNNKIILDDRELIWDTAYKSCQEDDTVYLKLDDDIVYFDETLFTDFINYRISNKIAPILYPVIINNHFISWHLQENNIINPILKSNIGNDWINTYNRIKNHIISNKNTKLRIGDFTSDNEVLCPIAWGNFKYCCDLHNIFIEDIKNNNIHKYYLKNNIILENCEAVSINVCSWIGSNLKKYTDTYGDVYYDEPWLSIYLPTWSGHRNELYGKCIVSHYSYYKQRELGLDLTDILDKYDKLCN